ncbi:MAG TPA: hypothetical protein VFL65_00735 [Jatrophihabitans sp.]|nr:hypothetical protein [Jatrophihabitans sp.]
MRVWVYVRGGPPHDGYLRSWGRASSGWWGLLTWRVRVREPGAAVAWLDCAAWVPSARLSLPNGRYRPDVPRVRLPANRVEWPLVGLLDWAGHYAGVWEVGPMPLPGGFEVATGWHRDDYPA